MSKHLIIPEGGIRDYVYNLAAEHAVRYERSVLDDMDEAITRLSGDSVEADDVEFLVIEMRRRGVIKGSQMLELLKNHLDEIGV